MAIKIYMAINAENEDALKEFFEKEAFQCVQDSSDAMHGIPLKSGNVSCQHIKDGEVKGECANLVYFQMDFKRYLMTGRMR